MASRHIVVLAVLIALCGASAATAAQDVEPRAGVTLSGMIRFPRAQELSIQTDPRDGRRFAAFLGFDGRCRGGTLSEVWASNVAARPVVRVRDGRFSARLSGTTRNLGDVAGRTGSFRWRFSGRFVERDVVTATVTGEAEVRVRGRVISRCTITEPASVRLAIRSN